MVGFGGGLQHLGDAGAFLLGFGLLRAGFGDFEAGFGGQDFHCINKAGAGRLHDEGNDIAMLAATEAMEMVVVDVEGRGLFAVKRAATFLVAA